MFDQSKINFRRCNGHAQLLELFKPMPHNLSWLFSSPPGVSLNSLLPVAGFQCQAFEGTFGRCVPNSNQRAEDVGLAWLTSQLQNPHAVRSTNHFSLQGSHWNWPFLYFEPVFGMHFTRPGLTWMALALSCSSSFEAFQVTSWGVVSERC